MMNQTKVAAQTASRSLTCKQRWAKHKNGRFRDLRRLWDAYQAGEQDEPTTPKHIKTREELGELYEYGLAFDYVAPGTFDRQREGYWRYQLSWGGPSDEIRFYSSSPSDEPYRIVYSFMDWYDGYHRKVAGRDEELALALWEFFQEVGSVESEYNKAREE
jgi:hypothetical protein